VQRPKCERKGALPHPATMIVAWELQSGRLWKYSCDEHAETFGGPVYNVSRLVGVIGGPMTERPTPVEIGDPQDHGHSELPDGPPEDERQCVRCGGVPLPYPEGHGGQLCQRCEDLQAQEHEAWKRAMRVRAAAGMGGSINRRRGF